MKNDSILYTYSVSKIVTAIAVMQQVERGRITLDDGINASLPFAVRNPKWPDVAITWSSLLSASALAEVPQSADVSSIDAIIVAS